MVRVPTEVIKQRMQAGLDATAISAVQRAVTDNGIMSLYTGFGITIFREIPFSLIQFPIYEALKVFAIFRSTTLCFTSLTPEIFHPFRRTLMITARIPQHLTRLHAVVHFPVL